MKQLLLVLLLLHGLDNAYAQQYFNKRYTFQSYSASITSILPVEKRYYCISLSRDSIYSRNWGIHFSVLDSVGDIVKDTAYVSNIRNIYPTNNSLKQLPNKNFLLAPASSEDSTFIDYCSLLKFDSTGNVGWDTEYTKSFCNEYTFWYIEDLKPTGTGGWLILSHILCSDMSVASHHQEDIVLTKLTSDFKVIWSKQYGDIHYDDIPSKITVANDGYVILSTRNNSNKVSSGFHYQAEIIKTDTSGNAIWSWVSDPTSNIGYVKDIVQTKDGGYVYCGWGNGIERSVGGSGLMEWKGWIEKLDAYRNVVWRDSIGVLQTDLPISSLVELPDSTVVVAGAIYGGFAPEDTIGHGHNFPCLLKYEQNGQLIWRRKYTHFDDSLTSRIYDMKQTPDGGFVLSGESDDYNHYYGNTTQQGYVLKVDSRGCESLTDPQCAHDGIRAVAATPFRVYPNPATSSITVDCPYTPAQEEFVITDVFGRPILTKKLLNMRESMDITTWPPGVYVYRVLSGGATVQTGRVVKY